MEFEDFAEQFRKRTAERLIEFEKTLEKAQRDMEQAATRAAANAKREAESASPAAGQNSWRRQPGQTGYGQEAGQVRSPGTAQPVNRPLDYRTPDIPGAWKPKTQNEQQYDAGQQLKTPNPAPRRAPGRVKSVLRRTID